MYTIGQFSRIGMISSSALRFYDEIGLLKPFTIDQWTGYRYYAENQVEDILFISEMREYGFSLEQIKTFMTSKGREDLLKRALEEKYEKLFWEEQKITYIRKKLKIKIDDMKGDERMVKGEKKMEVKVIDKEEVTKTMGISKLIPTWPPEDPSVFENLWTKYWAEDISNQVPNKTYPSVRYGILIFEKGSIYYMIADEVISYDNTPQGFATFDIPKGKYAACTFNGKTFEDLVNDSIQKANDYVLTTWLPQGKYKHAETFSLEIYDDRSRRKEYPEMDILQPIIEK